MSTAASGAGSKLRMLWNHPAGPKWGISFANIADMQRPAELVSYPQQCAITATGIIWSRFSTQITPKNYNLLAVNAFMAVTGIYQLQRKIRWDMSEEGKAKAAADAAAASAAVQVPPQA